MITLNLIYLNLFFMRFTFIYTQLYPLCRTFWHVPPLARMKKPYFLKLYLPESYILIICNHPSIQFLLVQHLRHLLVHLFLKLLHVPHLQVALQLRQQYLCLSLRLASLAEDLGFYVLLQLTFEIVIIFDL